MTTRVWSCVAAVVVILGIAVALTANSGGPQLRSRHAQPARVEMDETVSVNPEGNLFHAASCKDLHQPARTMSASEAVAKGYAPCTRCMRKALAQ